MAFNHDIKEQDGIQVISMSGRLLHMDEARLLDADIDALLEKGAKHFCVDMAGLQHMNSTGLGLLVRFLTRIRNTGGELVLTHVNDTLNKLLLITKLERVFSITESVDEAADLLKNG